MPADIVARKKIEEMDEAFFDEVMALNMKSVFLVTQVALRHMPDGSAIVNLSSLTARDGGGATIYCAARAQC
ncbi:MAG: SDR family oxidoreductase [Gemmatimonadaceae bacterium]|nr:SDR family oxidoreductase [Gemmatimonadaceae bacterium]